MKEETKRIMKLVQEGKLSPDDAAELIEAFSDAPDEPTTGQAEAGSEQATSSEGADKSKTEDPVSKLIGSIEKIGKDVAKNVNWNDIAIQVRESVGKGIDAIKHAAEDAKKGGGFSMFFGSTHVKKVELPLNVPEGKTLRIETRDGNVTILGGKETGYLTVEALFRSYDEAEAKSLADAYTPMIEEGDHLVIFRQPEGNNMTTNLSIGVPSGVPVELKMVSGDVTIENTLSQVKIDSSSGDVNVDKAQGSVQVSQRSGDISISNTEALVLTVESRSGDISMTNVTGVLEVKTSSGNVNMKAMKPKTLSVEAASGDVNLEFAEPLDGSVHLTAVSGDVNASILEGSNCRVNLSTLKGTVEIAVPLQDEAKEPHRISGRLGEGSGLLEVSVITGNVKLNPKDSSV